MQNPWELRVLAEALNLADALYHATRRFPVDERFGLTAQMRRAAVSIGSNIAEGAGRSTPAQFHAFLQIAAGSATELEFQLKLCVRLGYLDSETEATLASSVQDIKRMLGGLARRIVPLRTTLNG